MIKKIKNKIRNFVDIRVRLIKNQQRLNQQINFNYNQLAQIFQDENFIPFTAWSISPSTILHVLNDISINSRESIVEFGTGASTFYIAKLLKIQKKEAQFYAVESDKKWVNEMKRQLEIYGLEDYVKIIYAPLIEVKSELLFKGQKLWYDTNILENKFQDVQKFDLMLVDGPFGGSTPFARYSALPFLNSKLRNDASIYLDDVQRPDEKEIANKWQEKYGGEISYYERYIVLNKKTQSFDISPFQLQDLPL